MKLYPWQMADATKHPTHVAQGGSLMRRLQRTVTAARATHRERRHGAQGSSGGLRMRPPGGGVIDFQDPAGMYAPRVYTGDVSAGDLIIADEVDT